jgi:TPR repeat protein
MFEKGRGVAPDYAEAVRLYSLAAAQGNARAQKKLEGKKMKLGLLKPTGATCLRTG